MTRTWMITGASSGFGRALAEACLAGGDRVVATARDASSLDDLSGEVLALPLDVTDPTSVAGAVERALTWSGGVDVLVNNAGHGFAGAVEEITDDQLRRLLDVNVVGVATVTRALLPSMRARGSGHLIQISSVGGVRANPGHGAYAASKFALEGLSEALGLELAPFGIRVTIVEPGPFRTDFAGRSMGWAEPIAAYDGTPARETRERFVAQDGRQPGDPAAAAAAIRDVVEQDDPPLRLPMGPGVEDVLRTAYGNRVAELDRTGVVAT